MPRGGKRNGAGRRKGSEARKTKARRETAEEALAQGVSPLAVMLQAMRHHHATDNLDRAAQIAKDAAPYCHPHLSAITHKGDASQPIRLVEQFEVIDGDTNPPAPVTP